MRNHKKEYESEKNRIKRLVSKISLDDWELFSIKLKALNMSYSKWINAKIKEFIR